MNTQFIQQATGFPEDTIVKIMDAFVEFVKVSIKDGNQVEMTNFGVFSFKDLPERPGRNPHANIAITLPANRSPSFKYSKKFVDSIQPLVVATAIATPPSAHPSAPPVMPMTPPPQAPNNCYLTYAAGAFFEVPYHHTNTQG